MRFIEANITTFIGQDCDAEHFYCYYKINDDKNNLKSCSVSQHDEELTKPLNIESRIKLRKKDGYCFGDTTTRFDSIYEIHKLLVALFPNENIITYDECRPFREMLCIIDGENKGFEYIGEVWTCLPRSLFKDLIVGHNYKIRCCNCSKEFSLDEVIIDEYDNEIEKRPWVKFIKYSRDLDNPCCKRPELEWNLIY